MCYFKQSLYHTNNPMFSEEIYERIVKRNDMSNNINESVKQAIVSKLHQLFQQSELIIRKV